MRTGGELRIVLRCPVCGRLFTEAEWSKLRLVGYLGGRQAAQGCPWEAVEVRVCDQCEQPMVRPVPLVEVEVRVIKHEEEGKS